MARNIGEALLGGLSQGLGFAGQNLLPQLQQQKQNEQQDLLTQLALDKFSKSNEQFDKGFDYGVERDVVADEKDTRNFGFKQDQATENRRQFGLSFGLKQDQNERGIFESDRSYNQNEQKYLLDEMSTNARIRQGDERIQQGAQGLLNQGFDINAQQIRLAQGEVKTQQDVAGKNILNFLQESYPTEYGNLIKNLPDNPAAGDYKDLYEKIITNPWFGDKARKDPEFKALMENFIKVQSMTANSVLGNPLGGMNQPVVNPYLNMSEKEMEAERKRRGIK